MTYRDEGRSCLVPDCSEIAVARGRCRRHYMTWYRSERPEQNRAAQRRWREHVDYNGQRRRARAERKAS